MTILRPETPEVFASALAECSSSKQTIKIEGCGTKSRMAGYVREPNVCIQTTGLTKTLQYEPRDLTISVEAGCRWADLEALVARDGLMIPLDPPFTREATAGGVVATNSSGPRRRLYGTARDLIIGMTFATLEGKLVQSGGMVVKNVAGLDMAKLMVGSFGTLAGITSVNFKLVPVPPFWRTFLFRFSSAAAAIERRDAILNSVLQPAALDLLNPSAAAEIARESYLLLVRAGGSTTILDRYSKSLAGAEVLDGAAEEQFWNSVREFTPNFLSKHPDGSMVKVSTVLPEVGAVLEETTSPAVARSGSGVVYVHFSDGPTAVQWLGRAIEKGWRAVLEIRPPDLPPGVEMWPKPGDDFEIMKRVKQMFDPSNLLNRGRLYGRI